MESHLVIALGPLAVALLADAFGLVQKLLILRLAAESSNELATMVDLATIVHLFSQILFSQDL